MNIYNVSGYIFIALGILLNVRTIEIISGSQINFTVEKTVMLILLQGSFAAAGIYILIMKKKAVQNLLVAFGTFCVLILFLELLLSIPSLQNLKSGRPLWIPYKFKKLTSSFIKEHTRASLENRFGFNDKMHKYYGDPGSFRIAVLGDSFIWGYGAPDSVIWTRKLEKLFHKNGLNCKILNWGRSGWSTLDEFRFLKEEGYKFQFDYLLFAFVVNDPVMDSSDLKLILYPDGFIDKNILQPSSSVIPNSVSFLSDLTNNFFARYFNYGYYKWLEYSVYTENNLKKYSALLNEIKQYCNEKKIAFSFIMTPENHNPLLKRYFKRAELLFKKENIDHCNLFPAIRNTLLKYPERELWANPGDGHPGNPVTDVYAQYTFRYILDSSNTVPKHGTIH